MGLEQRLRLLRGEVALGQPRQAGTIRPDSAARESKQEDLGARLRRLSVASRRAQPRCAPDEDALAEALGARRLAAGVLLVTHSVPLARLPGPGGAEVVASLPTLIEGDGGDPRGWCFLDTETSGLAGGTGTWAFLCGFARIQGPDLVLDQYLLTRLDAEPAYLDALRAVLAPAALLVSYNGKAFDVPLLTTRLRLANLRLGLDAKAHLDLLFPVRRAFARRWPDCRLSTAEKRLLGLSRQGDLPGSEAPGAWLAWLRQGETTPLLGVIEHNRRDLISLPALVSQLARAFCDPAAMGADVHAIARHRLERGDARSALALLERNRERLDADGLLTLARLHRLQGRWDAALAIWEPLAEQGIPAALEALAKYLEHQVGDYPRALGVASRLPPGEERQRRCRRLQERMGAMSDLAQRIPDGVPGREIVQACCVDWPEARSPTQR